MKMRPKDHALRNATFSAFLVSAIVLAGCGDDRSEAARAESPSEFFEMLEGYSADYEPAKSPSELAEWSELVVGGKMVEVVQGRTFYPGEPSESRTVVIVVEADSSHKGALPEGSDGRVYVEFDATYNRPAETYDRSLPRDADVLMYLVRASGGESDPIQDEKSGRPDGQPLWRFTNPQGFLVGVNDDEVVQAQDFQKYPGASLEQFIPENEKYPPADPNQREE